MAPRRGPGREDGEAVIQHGFIHSLNTYISSLLRTYLISAYLQNARLFVLLTSLFQLVSSVAQAQEFDVRDEHFPGAKRVKVEAFGRGPSGFWAEYTLDEQGWAIESRTYHHRKLNLLEQYSFTSRHKLGQERTVTTDDKRVQIFQYSYQYSPDSARIIREIGLSDSDTMYVSHNLEFDSANRPVKFTKSKGLRREVNELTELTYANDLITNYRRTEYGEKDTTVFTTTYQYNAQGNLTKEYRSVVPKSPGNWWLDNSGDQPEYSYDYSKRGPWTHRYLLRQGRKVLIAKRTFTY
ncbi:hypothetical protein [Hymenobacter metallilatus]|uniref:RHS repeat protein n=1 Tax=Hymenobacter metallilatus TaxID=2493666 RepID=A0A3R9NBE3_9BACT|nr:hypothetical protein [Hymenobacter metallilatus]RSK29604.1 hypothetical protein EI290_17195 [Hymenobacter metallilatus]